MTFPHLLLILLFTMVWGFNFVVIEVGLKEISPFLLGFIRFFLTSLPAVFFIKRPETSWRMLLGYGFLMFTLPFAFLFTGMDKGVPPGLASLLLQTQVFFTPLLALFFFSEKLHPWQVIGALIAFSGIVLVGMHLGGQITWEGFLLVLASAFCWSLGNIVSKKMGKVNMLSVVIWGSLVAWPPLLLLASILEGPQQVLSTFSHLNWTAIGAIFYIAYLSTLLGFWIWNYLIYYHPLTTIAPFTLLIPIFGCLSSVLVLKEPMEFWKLSAAFLVLIGLSINLFGAKLFKGNMRFMKKRK